MRNEKIKIFLLTVVMMGGMLSPIHAELYGTSSTYSRFGLGTMAEQSQSYNRSMGGVAQGLRYGNRINKLNPASYSAVDSLSFIFDAGMTLSRMRMSTSTQSMGVNNAVIDYVAAECRLVKNLGLSFGFMPYSDVAYNFAQSYDVKYDNYYNVSVTQTISSVGTGGLHEFYLGAGWEPFKNFSFGFNAAFLWGDFTHSVTQTFYEDGTSNTTDYSSMNSLYYTEIRTWRLDVGAQYEIPFNKERTDVITLGATVGIGHNLGADSKLLRYTLNADTTHHRANKAYEIPMTYSGGIAWQHKDQLTIAADFTYEQWGKCTVPVVHYENDTWGRQYMAYDAMTGQLKDRMKFNIGAEFVPDRYARFYPKRINYRLGFYYNTPYQYVNGVTGPRELSITAGFGFPTINNRSYVNVGFQWLQRNAHRSDMILENAYMITIGLTFNERWFMKWKFQ